MSRRTRIVVLVAQTLGLIPCAMAQVDLPTSVSCSEIRLLQPLPATLGGLFAHDLDGDGARELIVTSEGHIAAYALTGEALWVRRCSILLWPYTHQPSAIAGDLDGDEKQEVAYLCSPTGICVLDGVSGEQEGALVAPRATFALAIANLRGEGDREILVQFSQTHIAALRADTAELLWETEEYRGIEHSPLRQADIDGDGRDEVAGAVLINDDGKRMNAWDLGGAYRSVDSLVIADVEPGYPLEVVLAEQRGAESHTDVVNPERIVSRALNPWSWEDPDKVAVGDFAPELPGLEIFNRSSGGDGTARRGKEEPFSNEEAPWVLDATGRLLAKFYINDRKPDWWHSHGIEEVCRIDWDGDAADELVCKERHTNGAGAILAPLTGDFRCIFPGRAIIVYAADLLGDSREEVVTIDEGGMLRLFANEAENANAPRPSPWGSGHYARQKQNWNYYSP